MKLRNDHELFNGLCCGCNAAVKGEDVNPDCLYRKLLCGRCLAELEELPLRHKVVFDRLKREMEKVIGRVEFLNTKVALLEGFIISHGLNPDAAG